MAMTRCRRFILVTHRELDKSFILGVLLCLYSFSYSYRSILDERLRSIPSSTIVIDAKNSEHSTKGGKIASGDSTVGNGFLRTVKSPLIHDHAKINAGGNAVHDEDIKRKPRYQY
jgi:hypothetical protein